MFFFSGGVKPYSSANLCRLDCSLGLLPGLASESSLLKPKQSGQFSK